MKAVFQASKTYVDTQTHVGVVFNKVPEAHGIRRAIAVLTNGDDGDVAGNRPIRRNRMTGRISGLRENFVLPVVFQMAV